MDHWQQSLARPTHQAQVAGHEIHKDNHYLTMEDMLNRGPSPSSSSSESYSTRFTLSTPTPVSDPAPPSHGRQPPGRASGYDYSPSPYLRQPVPSSSYLGPGQPATSPTSQAGQHILQEPSPFETQQRRNALGGSPYDDRYYDRYMTHPQTRGWESSNVPQNRTLPLPLSSMSPAPPTLRHCGICLEQLAAEEFPHKCLKCSHGGFCANCLKDWFIDACKNESKMPPKCCSAIPLSSISNLLTTAQVELYKAKYEEWSTVDRLYCPVPTCSTFISPRLYIEQSQNPKGTETEDVIKRMPRKKSSDFSSLPSYPSGRKNVPNVSNQEQLEVPANNPLRPRVACPTCFTSVCTKCHSITHLGDCPETDLDPALEEKLKKWKIKRCPKCRTGVRKMFGCTHIECRCSAHFCWECLKPMAHCDGGCDDEGSDDNRDPEDFEEDDIDGRAGYYDGDGHEFGDEPYGTVIDSWSCDHKFSEVLVFHSLNRSGQSQSVLECHRCFRVAKIRDETLPKADPSFLWPPNIFDQPAWKCFSGHNVCDRCPKLPPPHRAGDVSWMWACDCGKSCELCDREKAREHKDKVDEVAWECRCGMILCGGCKEIA